MTERSFFAGSNSLGKGRLRAPFRILLAVASVWLLCGLSFPKAHLRVPQTVSPVYKFADARDPKLARSAAESLMITNCAYGAVRIGQRDIEPDLVMLLHGMLASRFGDRLGGRDIKLTAFSLHINNAAMLRRSVPGNYSQGLIPSMVSGLMNDKRKVGCSSDDTRGGYVIDEVPDGASPFIVAVHVSIDGKPYRGRSITAALGRMQALPGTPKADVNGSGTLSPRDEMYQRGIDEALTRLGDAIQSGLLSPAAEANAADSSQPSAPVGVEAPTSAQVPQEPVPSPTP